MSVVLKRLFVKRKRDEGPVVVRPVVLDVRAPNDDRAYAQRIEDRIVVRLVTPKLEGKPGVEHVERRDRDRKSKRLDEDRIQRMVRLDELVFKYAAHSTGMFSDGPGLRRTARSRRSVFFFFGGGSGEEKKKYRLREHRIKLTYAR